MATLKTCIQKMRSDGFYPVYIRVVHGRESAFIKTGKVVAKKSVSKTREIRDTEVLRYCVELITEYNKRLNLHDISSWTIKEVVSFLVNSDADINFSQYARKYADNLINTGHERTAKNYKTALRHLERYIGTNNIKFSQLTSNVLTKWIGTMVENNRCKEMYPVCMRQVFKKALIEFNDEEKGIIRIKFNPWLKVQIPKADYTAKKAISAEACREFFNSPLPESKMVNPLPEIGRDVAMMVLCLAGMNTADIFQLKKENYRGGIINYKRAKTCNSRSDGAYMEMRVEPFIQPIIDKYLADEDDEYLFNFHLRYTSFDSFCANVNNGIKLCCKHLGIKQEDYYSVYTFRHTWATIAQNDCGASISEVGFGLNHSHGNRVTRGYIKLDFTPAWEFNAKIIDFIFYSDKPSKQGLVNQVDAPQDKIFRV